MNDSRPTNPPLTAIAEPPSVAAAPAAAQHAIVWVLWATYGAFYFCRNNISTAVPGMTSPTSAGGLGLSSEQMGLILGSLKLTYAVGQLVNGQLAERFSPRSMLAIGMFVSAGLNLAFGFASGFYFLLFIWAMNGYCQALGWTPCMRVAANWIQPSLRGRAIGIIGTGYQITAAGTFFLAGWSVSLLDSWRGAFLVPPLLLVGVGLFMLIFLRESPPDESRLAGHAPHATPRGRIVENILLTLSNPAVWLLGISLGLLNACRYGFMDWGVAHLTDIHGGGEATNATVARQAVKYMFLPLGGVLGAFCAGWMTDRWFGGRRAPVMVGLLTLLGLLSLIYDQVARHSFIGTIVLLVVIGFTVFGPQVLLVGTAPSDLARRGTAAAAVGFVNFVGYLGAFAGDYVTGHVLSHFDWHVAVNVWAAWAFAAAAFAAMLWNAAARPGATDQVKST